uniref:Uncharacterized protein AlNc14C148G7450 n=1 Tax=Albugo laibachii Nc14 TaxID=890382 RepID=F0WLS7_9STRA|nr:conserved hypothetical protein [Albugo laibachii Nc14]|eukprot:CCA22251.1 conserved hypothetical protein [Albugo laibachii Nc14]
MFAYGQLRATEEITVDIGTGYYLEYKSDDAMTFVDRKVEFLDTNIASIKHILEEKRNTLSGVVYVMQGKLQSLKSSEKNTNAPSAHHSVKDAEILQLQPSFHHMNTTPHDKEARDTENEVQQLRAFIGTTARSVIPNNANVLLVEMMRSEMVLLERIRQKERIIQDLRSKTKEFQEFIASERTRETELKNTLHSTKSKLQTLEEKRILVEIKQKQFQDILAAIESNKTQVRAKISHLRISLLEEQSGLRHSVEYCERLCSLKHRLDDELRQELEVIDWMAQRSSSPIQRTRAKMRYMSEHLGGLQKELGDLDEMRRSIKREHDDLKDRMEQVQKDLIDNEKQFHISYRIKMKEVYANEEENKLLASRLKAKQQRFKISMQSKNQTLCHRIKFVQAEMEGVLLLNEDGLSLIQELESRHQAIECRCVIVRFVSKTLLIARMNVWNGNDSLINRIDYSQSEMNTTTSLFNDANRKKQLDITNMRITESEARARINLYKSFMVSLKLKAEQKGLRARSMEITQDEDDQALDGYQTRLACIIHQNKDLEKEELILQKRKSDVLQLYRLKKNFNVTMHAAHLQFIGKDRELAVEDSTISLSLEECTKLETTLISFIEKETRQADTTLEFIGSSRFLLLSSVQKTLSQKAQRLKDAKNEFSDKMQQIQRIQNDEKTQLEANFQEQFHQIEQKYACASGNIPLTKDIMEKHPDLLEARGNTSYAYTPLHIAARYGHTKVIEKLLFYGANLISTEAQVSIPVLPVITSHQLSLDAQRFISQQHTDTSTLSNCFFPRNQSPSRHTYALPFHTQSSTILLVA